MNMKMRILIVTLVCCLIAGCHTDHVVPAGQQSYMGVYAYKSVDTSVDKPTDHEHDQLTLQPDGTYILVQGGSTKPRSEQIGLWHLVSGTQQPEIELDHAGYPIRMKGSKIRLLINDDLGEWYEKVR